MQSEKSQKVQEFMSVIQDRSLQEKKYLQHIPDKPIIPHKDVRELRAALIYEEAIEAIKAMGVSIYPKEEKSITDLKMSDLEFEADKDCNIIEVADGLADSEVVVLGTYLTFGLLNDSEIFSEIHRSNMSKFPLGYNGMRPDGKWVKPDNFNEPDLKPIVILED